MSRKSREFSRDFNVKKSRVFNVAQIWQNLPKFFLFLAVFSDFRGILWGTMDVQNVAHVGQDFCATFCARDF